MKFILCHILRWHRDQQWFSGYDGHPFNRCVDCGRAQHNSGLVPYGLTQERTLGTLHFFWWGVLAWGAGQVVRALLIALGVRL